MDEAAEERTALLTYSGLFRNERVPFALKDGPGKAHCATNVSFATVKWQYALVYFDVFVVYLQTPSQHIQQAATVLRLIMSAKLALELKKCFFLTRPFDCCGHTILPKTIEVAAEKTDAIYGFKTAINVGELGSFHGLRNVYCRLVPSFSTIAALPNGKLKKGDPRYFGVEEKDLAVMEQWKEKLTTTPVLALLKRER